MQHTMVQKLLADFPAISEALKADDSLAKKLSPLLQNALVAGLSDRGRSPSAARCYCNTHRIF